MRRWNNLAGVSWLRALSGCAFALIIAGCSLTSPGCSNRSVRSGIEQDARNSIDLWLTTSLGKPLPSNVRVAISNTYETFRSGNARTCSGTINVGDKKDAVAVQIEYGVMRADDGQVLYQWDKEAFGKSFMGSAMMSALTSALAPKATPEPPAADEAPVSEERPHVDVRLEMKEWREGVIEMINAQARHFPIEGSGSVGISFNVSVSGEISGVQVQQSSGNAGLDATAIRMAEKAHQVAPPPNQQATHISVKLSFL